MSKILVYPKSERKNERKGRKRKPERERESNTSHTSLSNLPLEVTLKLVWGSLNHLMDLAAAAHPIACAEYECPCKRAFSYRHNKMVLIFCMCIKTNARFIYNA